MALSQYELAVKCIIYECPDPLASRINGIPVVIVQIQGDYYWTRFSYQGVYYDLETSNLSLDQLEELLVGIIS